MTARAPVEFTEQATLYLDLLKRCVTNVIYQDPAIRYPTDTSTDALHVPFDRTKRETGQDWPSQGHTMIGIPRLDNVQELVLDVLARDVPGDLIETGVWRGGSVIFMRGLLKVLGVTDRVVWVADSFEALQSPRSRGRGRGRTRRRR